MRTHYVKVELDTYYIQVEAETEEEAKHEALVDLCVNQDSHSITATCVKFDDLPLPVQQHYEEK